MTSREGAAPGGPRQRALTTSRGSRTPSTRARWLPVVARRTLPAVTRSAAALVVGFAADYTLRALARRAVDGVIAPFRRRQHVLTERRVVTELTVVERGERKR
ncbi:MAG TPA: hypothetical protein QF624_09635 [Dehalococcoidia bacterium]|nr:hypothetical protein [Dehalococcoidia bacterium]